MAGVARDDLNVIRIPRKVILAEIVKKIGGRKPDYESLYDEGNYWCMARTVIATSEADTSGKLEEATRMLASTREDAEEEAARALLELLKKVYRFEIDDMNFIAQTNNERCKERLEQDICAVRRMLNCEARKAKKLAKGWTKSLDDVNFVHEVCEEVCENGLANLPVDCITGSEKELIYDVHCLMDWTEGKIYEGISNLEDAMNQKSGRYHVRCINGCRSAVCKYVW